MATVVSSLPARVAPASVLDKARQTLRLAEAKTGARPVGANPEFRPQVSRAVSGAVSGAVTGAVSGAVSGAISTAVPNRTMPSGRPGPGGLSGADPAIQKAPADSLRTYWRQLSPAELAELAGPHFLPGTVVQVSGSLASFWAVAATGMGEEDWAGIAGLPEAGLLAAAEAGLVLSRTVVVPNLGQQPLRVLAALVDAYGLVMAGGLELGAGDRRRIEARLRFTGGRLVTTGEWGGAKLIVRVKATHNLPLGEGQIAAGQPRLDFEMVCKGGFES